MKRFTIIIVMLAGAFSLAGAQTFKGHFVNDEFKIQMVLNLYADSIAVPGIDDEMCYGYISGNTNGTWVILKVISVEKEKAVFRASCDNGSDSQNVELTLEDGKLVMRQLKDAYIKTVADRKYVKLPKAVEFQDIARQKLPVPKAVLPK
jgi:hypothetical protein